MVESNHAISCKFRLFQRTSLGFCLECSGELQVSYVKGSRGIGREHASSA
jgi:hypothetical protein